MVNHYAHSNDWGKQTIRENIGIEHEAEISKNDSEDMRPLFKILW